MIGSGGDGGGKQVEVDSIGKSIEERSAAWQGRAFRRVPDGAARPELVPSGKQEQTSEVAGRKHTTIKSNYDSRFNRPGRTRFLVVFDRALLGWYLACPMPAVDFPTTAVTRFTRND